MARNWVVLAANRAPYVEGMIISYTEWDGYPNAADEYIYSDPQDADGNPVDGDWRVTGSVALAGGVYTYTPPPATGWILENGLLTAAPPLSSLEQLKVDARACHQQLLAWSAALAVEAITHSSTDVAIGHDILFRGHEGVWLTCHRVDLFHAQKSVFCQQTAIGALDVTNPAEFFALVHTITNEPITGPVCWVNPETGIRFLFANIPPSTGEYFLGLTPPTSAELSGGAWIETLE